ncbi:MAG: RidA family protein [Candidatus Poseidoniia archaeon]|jgi:enamine deaminase RidA (YjgF/YER057c/UK114 family)|nr:RidA family protein [Candidatus Poseidoniia archaeon]MDP6658956.1 RidA family protein [Candidatus Poseidoniia archaeon]MDP6846572.1 RidA family protein [Candidatus Poseidoniia archaeon]MDP7006716.1 RidA family protein [Candidatus Poseidoniia archaeon]|tara:strand:- start:3108 stop:3497 length:390 start_codon:yes stop_codon:yes gene_type:complete
MTRRISSGSDWERRASYSRAVVAGEWVFVSGTTGFDYATMEISDDVAEQAERALDNIVAALAEAGCSLDDVVRVTYILVDENDFKCIVPVIGCRFAVARPAATALIAKLVDPRIRVEIEVTARLPAGER